MNEIQLIERAKLLIEQNRPQQAEELLRQALSLSPGLGVAHSMLALCLLNREGQLKEATAEAEQGIHFSPDDGFSFYIHGVVLNQRNRIDEAIASTASAIAIDPAAATYHGLMAQLQTRKSNWKEALASAETGLQYDAEDEICRAMRSMALERLGRVTDALDEADRGVRQNPDSAFAHASRGHALLNTGNHKEAQIAFREALRLEPTNEFARSGMIQSLNANNFVFRVMMAFMVWLSRMNPKVQFGLVIGLLVGINILSSLSAQHPWLAPYVMPIKVFYMLFVMMSWIATPLFNMFLRFHKFGRHLLTTKEKWASNVIALALGFGVFASLAWFLFLANIGLANQWQLSFCVLLFSIYLTVPLSVAFETEPGWPTKIATVIAIAFSVLFFVLVYLFTIGIRTFEQNPEMAGTVTQVYLFGILIYCFAGAKLRNAEPKH